MPPPKGTPNPLEGPGDYDFTTKVHSVTYPFISPLTSKPINKSVFIAGASRGIGLATAISFAQAGASKIAIAARSDLSSIKPILLAAAAKAGRQEPQILAVKLDVTSQSSTEEAAKIVEKELGNLDILILNAGVLGIMNPIIDSKPDQWWDTMTVNLKGPYLVARALLPLMLKGGDKTIVTTSSVGSQLVNPTGSAYQISKFAVLRLMEFVSSDYGDQGVVGFCIHPGNIVTDIVGGEAGLQDWMREIFVDTAPLAGDSIVFLTRERREWLAGRYINVTWDLEELMAMKDEIVKADKLKMRLVL